MVGGVTAVSLAVGGVDVVVVVVVTVVVSVLVLSVEAVEPSEEVPSPPPQAERSTAIAAHKTK